MAVLHTAQVALGLLLQLSHAQRYRTSTGDVGNIYSLGEVGWEQNDQMRTLRAQTLEMCKNHCLIPKCVTRNRFGP